MDRYPDSILFVLEHFPPYTGGVETLFFNLAKELSQRGVRVEVLTSGHRKELPLKEVMEGITVHRIPSGNRYWFTLMAIPAAIRLAARCRLVHTSTYNAAVPAFIAGLFTRRKVVITVHEVWGNLWFRFPWMPRFTGFLHHLFEKALLALPFARFVAVSEFTAAALREQGIPGEKISTVYNGVDYERLRQFAGPAKQDMKRDAAFVYFGRLGHSKGIDLIIEGGGEYLESNPDALVEMIIPDVPAKFRRRVERRVAASAAAGRFVITGTLPAEALYARIRHCTAVLIPSYSEGFCFAAAEATALDVPIVSSDRGALKETAGGRVVVMEGLTAASLCNAMARAARGEWEIRPANRFPLDGQVRRYLDLYEHL